MTLSASGAVRSGAGLTIPNRNHIQRTPCVFSEWGKDAV